MPAPAHVRITWSGIFGTVAAPVDDWQFGLKASLGTFNDVPTNPIATSLFGCLSQLDGAYGSNVIATSCKAVIMGADGKYMTNTETGAYFLGEHNGTRPGTSQDTGPMPLQVSLAVSLVTALNQPVGRGRFYLPTPATGGLTTEARVMTTARRDQYVAMAKGFIDAVNAVLAPINSEVVVASAGSVKKAIPPTLRPVTSVRVGRRVDIQRRRARDIDEEYGSAALA